MKIGDLIKTTFPNPHKNKDAPFGIILRKVGNRYLVMTRFGHVVDFREYEIEIFASGEVAYE